MANNWSHILIEIEAVEYSTRSAFARGAPGAYAAAHRLGIINEVTRHMPKPRVWDHDSLVTEALEYQEYSAFIKNSSGALGAAKRLGILEQITVHMKFTKQWTDKSEIALEARKYDSRSAFQKSSPGAHGAAKRLGIWDDVTSHMKIQGSLYLRFVYAYVFNATNEVYVGLTYKLNTRHLEHMQKKNTYKLGGLLRTPDVYYDYVTTSEPMEVELASKEEVDWVNYYKDAGFTILNIATPGNLGGNVIKWSKEAITTEAAKYENRNDFAKGSSGALAAARTLGIMDEVTPHMPKPKRWDYDSIAVVALLYTCRDDFAKSRHQPAYNAALRLDILDEVAPHMPKPTQWNDDSISTEAAKYLTVGEFREHSSKAYNAAKRRKILSKVLAHTNYKPRKRRG